MQDVVTNASSTVSTVSAVRLFGIMVIEKLDDLEQRVRNEHIWNLNLIPHDFLLFVRIFLSAVIANYFDLLRQHGKRCVRVGLSEQDFVLVPGIAFVVKSAIFADNQPEIVGRIFHWGSALQVPHDLGARLPYIMPFWNQWVSDNP